MQTTPINHPQTGGIDLFRIPAALLVVSIHTSPLGSFGGEADFILTRILARTAVPFFFMATGYFLLPPCFSGSERLGQTEALGKSFRKILGLYLAATLIYLPVGIYAGHLHNRTFPSLLRLFLFEGTFYHLWYLPACILGILLLLPAGRLLPFGALFAVTALLYLLGLPGDSYYGFLPEGSTTKKVYDLLLDIFSQTRGGLFYAPLFLAQGAGIRLLTERRADQGVPLPKRSAARHIPLPKRSTAPHIPLAESSATRRTLLSAARSALLPERQAVRRILLCAGLLCSLAGMTAEGLLLHRLDVQKHDSMYLALPLVMFFLFSLLLTVRRPPDRHLRKLSTWIYLLHPLAIILVRGAAKALHLEQLFITNSLLHFLSVCLLSWALSAVGCRLADALGAACRRLPSGKRPGYCLPLSGALNAVCRRLANSPGTVCRRPSCVCPKSGRTKQPPRAWIELSGDSLRHNVRALQSLLSPGCALMCVLKANAYGHGALPLAHALNRMGIDNFCVATLSEGIELRRGGIRGEILILGYTHPDRFSDLAKYRLTQTVLDGAYAEQLSACKRKLNVHLKIDTGMHRLGERPEREDELYRVFQYKNLRVTGTYTHLCCADSDEPADISFCTGQKNAFRKTVRALEGRGCDCGKLHLLASHGLIRYPEWGGDLVRTGIALYGVLSRREDLKNCPVRLRPVLSLKARVARVQTIRAGEGVGYGLEYVAGRDGKIAVLAIGYADGIPRSLSCGRGRVLIGRREAPIVGRICMDQMFVDITGIPDVKAGDIAVLIGKSGNREITAYDLAEGTGTITNELLSRLGGRLERVLR